MTNESASAEKSVIQSPVTDSSKVEIRTNTRLRQKYFVSENEVVSSVRGKPFSGHKRYSRIISSKSLSKAAQAKRVLVQLNQAPLPGDIQVEVLKDGAKISGIRITCPCGRHTELNFEYEPPA